MSSLKQVIVQAIIKVAGQNPALDREGEPSAEEARDMFIQALIAELFPNEEVAEVKKSPKKSSEDKEAAKAAKAQAKEVAKAAKEAEKKAKAEAKAEKKVAKASPKKEEVPALPVSPPKKAKKASKVDANANLQKIDPTWRKALKEADKEHAKELEPELLKYLNDMSNVAFHGKGVKEHVAEFVASRKPVATEPETDLEVVEFKGKDYYVNPETKRVYEGELDSEGSLKVTRPVGYVGMAEFKDMVLDNDVVDNFKAMALE